MLSLLGAIAALIIDTKFCNQRDQSSFAWNSEAGSPDNDASAYAWLGRGGEAVSGKLWSYVCQSTDSMPLTYAEEMEQSQQKVTQ